jgi:hypothetical protein
LNIEYLRYSFDFKKDGAKRHQQIFNLQSSIPALPGWVVINGWWEWPPATITRVIAVKNRSHNPKTNGSKLQSFFFD